jgi:hypothetical protein
LAYFIGADFAPSGTPLLAAENVGEAQCPPVAGAQVKLQEGVFACVLFPGDHRPIGQLRFDDRRRHSVAIDDLVVGDVQRRDEAAVARQDDGATRNSSRS